ncbi:LysR family transcriptional regulator [Nocardioides sp. zg-1228]|uniref:LysR family transcriptional regulator n=1 Tax=Nocardioides sp. zg-1228 TaxID=2763008 RepID=UPI0016434A46|nr:LysR family transcriptional regulator [Nocardioides sp. zg-1228]MBC2931527.1 LysR family transcriptional regulator [Nocardioides sp. zg-1228]QSF57129.1 LysR family transcriptional regulator [Nocardioides sp. zg-1228]
MALTAWRTFVAVCEAGSFTAAAEELGYTQSAISRQVASLEHDLGEALLERLPRGVRPTAAGQALLPHARLLVGEAARARDAVRRARAGDAVPLTLGAVPSASVDLVPRTLRSLPAEGPRVALRSDGSARLHERVRTGDVDVAVVTDYPPGLPTDPEVRRTRLLEDEMCVVLAAGHALAAGRRRVRLTSFADEIWAEDHPGSGSLLERAAGRVGFEPRVELVAGDLLGKVALVAAGLAVALVPAMLVPGLPAGVAVRRLVAPPTRTVYALSRERRPRPGVQELTAALVAAASGSAR